MKRLATLFTLLLTLTARADSRLNMIPTTTQLSRQLLSLETVQDWQSALGFIGGGAATNVFFASTPFAQWTNNNGTNSFLIVGVQPATPNGSNWSMWDTNTFANAASNRAMLALGSAAFTSSSAYDANGAAAPKANTNSPTIWTPTIVGAFNGSGATNVTASGLQNRGAIGPSGAQASISTTGNNGFSIADADGSTLGITGAGFHGHWTNASFIPPIEVDDTLNNPFFIVYGGTNGGIWSSAGIYLQGNSTNLGNLTAGSLNVASAFAVDSFGNVQLTGTKYTASIWGAKTLIMADTSLGAISLANGSGFLKDDGSGNFAWTFNGNGMTNLTAPPAAGHTNAILERPDGTLTTNDVSNLGGGGSGSVTSVGLTMPQEYSVSGSPVTGSGTLGVTRTGTANWNGLGATNIGSLSVTGAISAQELDAGNFYPTNLFLPFSNSIVAVNSNGQVIPLTIGSGLSFNTSTYTLTGTGGGTTPGIVSSNCFVSDTNPVVWDMQKVQHFTVMIETNMGPLIVSNAWAITNYGGWMQCDKWENTNGDWRMTMVQVVNGLARTNGNGIWAGTNANEYDSATVKLDGTGTNALWSWETNYLAGLSYTNSIGGGGGGGGGSFPAGALIDWQLDNGLTDSSGNAHDASTLTGSTTYTTGQDGTANHAATISANTFGLTDGTVASFSTLAFSTSVWIKPTGTTGTQVFLSKGLNNNEGYYEAMSGTEINVIINQSGGTETCATSGAGLTAGTWYNIVFIGNAGGATGKIYVNGVDKTSGAPSLTPPVANNTYKLQVGDYTGTGFPFAGVVDEVAIWASSLSSTDPAAIYSLGAR